MSEQVGIQNPLITLQEWWQPELDRLDVRRAYYSRRNTQFVILTIIAAVVTMFTELGLIAQLVAVSGYFYTLHHERIIITRAIGILDCARKARESYELLANTIMAERDFGLPPAEPEGRES